MSVVSGYARTAPIPHRYCMPTDANHRLARGDQGGLFGVALQVSSAVSRADGGPVSHPCLGRVSLASGHAPWWGPDGFLTVRAASGSRLVMVDSVG